MIYDVIRKGDGVKVYEYNSEEPIEWDGMGFAEFDHMARESQAITAEIVPPPRWRIDVGAFHDRFGTAKLAILSDPDPIIQALIKDISIRKYVALTERRMELLQAMTYIASRGHNIDPIAILDTEPTVDEVWNG